jgi:hypothetical protein
MPSSEHTPPWRGQVLQHSGSPSDVQLLLKLVKQAPAAPLPSADPAALARRVAAEAEGLPAVREWRALCDQEAAAKVAGRSVADDLAGVGRDRRQALCELNGSARQDRLRELAEQEAALDATATSFLQTLRQLRRQVEDASRAAGWAVQYLAEATERQAAPVISIEGAVTEFLAVPAVAAALDKLARVVRTPHPALGRVSELARRLVLGEAPPPPAPAGPPPPPATRVFELPGEVPGPSHYRPAGGPGRPQEAPTPAPSGAAV